MEPIFIDHKCKCGYTHYIKMGGNEIKYYMCSYCAQIWMVYKKIWSPHIP